MANAKTTENKICYSCLKLKKRKELLQFYNRQVVIKLSKPAMSNPNGLLSHKLCHYLNQDRTFNNTLMRVAR